MDIKIYETGNGGDIMIRGNDLESVQSFENMPYLGMFGGNVEQTTDQVGETDEQRFDWWGNSFLFDLPTQLNSITERTLINTPITSQGRILIENAIKADLQFMQSFAIVTVAVTIISDDWLNIAIGIREPSNQNNYLYQFIWDAAKGKILGDDNYSGPNFPFPEGDFRITEDGFYRLLMDGSRRLYTR